MKLKHIVITALGLLCASATHSFAWQSDNGDGTYKNPVLYADYPDPDIIRVGEDYYMASSTFVDSPGLNVLHSKDLVNWELATHAANEVNGGDRFNMIGGTEYRHGFWAPSIRYHNGMFYIVNNPTFGNGRIYYATNIAGPWQYHQLNRGVYDPGFFIDADGTGYIVCGNTRLEILTLNSDYSQVVSATPIASITGIPGIEGSHLLKRGKYYYLFNAVPSSMPFQLKCSRATNVFGPYETITSLNSTTGGHQGAIVEMANGEWSGFIMKDAGAIGRMTYISPVFWTNDWPVWGTPEAPGKVPAVARKPVQGQPIMQPATSDEFSSPTLGLQWQWNHNPDNVRWSLTERPGYLRLKSTQATNFWFARNTLTQKGQGPWSRGTVKLDLAGLKLGDVCGFGTLGKYNGHIAVHCGDDGKLYLSMDVLVAGGLNETRVASVPVVGKEIYLRTDMDFARNRATCAYSVDGEQWTNLGGEFQLAFDWQFGTFQGQKFAIFCFNPQAGDGFVDVDWFHFSDVKDKTEPTSAALTNEQAASAVVAPPSQPQPVAFDWFEYSGRDDVEPKAASGEYHNPILAGFYPDPSICRVGDDYYLINSSFAYFPGIPIFHSRDLVNWEQIGNAIHRPDQLRYDRQGVSGAIFAPTIRNHNGVFYVICTMVGAEGNFIVTATNAAGPWSNPVKLGFEGIDPSLFFDEDGRAWVINNGGPEGRPLYDGHRAIWLQEYDLVAQKMTGPRKVIVNGGVDISKKPIWIEGPHLYKRDGWYYLCCAEGGTGPQHSQVIFRSQQVDGSYTPWEGNPILSQRNLSANEPGAVTCTGHADMVIGPDNNWWAVFLGVRPYQGRYSPMGRETFLLPVKWTDDGWPVILPKGERVPLTVKSPNQVALNPSPAMPLSGDFTWRDDFKESSLSPLWIMLRTPKESWWSVDATAGKLKLAPRAEELSGRGNPSYLGHRVQHAHFSASTELAVPVESNVSAGLAVFQGERFNCFAGVRREANGVVLFVEQTRGRASDVLKTERLDNMAKLQIRIVADDAKCRFEYAADGGEWKPLATDIDATLLTTDVAGGFVGATVGLYARFDGKLMPAPTVSHSDSKPGADFIAKAVRIKAGQSTPLTDSAGHVWLPDQGFEGGNVVGHDDSLTIAGTKEPALFQTEHYGMSAFACNIPNGKYTANLYFAETYDGITGAGQRVFSFDVQGREFKDFDVWAKAGGSNKAYVESIPVEVTNGVFRIRFVANNENPQINAVEIIPQG